jgi:hypothetical protein
LKTFDGLYAVLGKREIVAFRRLKSHDNLLRPLAAFATRDDRDPRSLLAPFKSRIAYSILLEYCDLDLGGYFASLNPPVTFHEIERFWGNLSKVIDAVAQLHQGYQDVHVGKEVVTETVGCVASMSTLFFSWLMTYI